MSTQTNLRILIALIFLALLTACGSSKSLPESQDFSSAGGTASKTIAKCNKAGSPTLSYKTAAQISGNTFDPNFVNLYLSNLPTGFEAGTSYIQFSKGQANGDAAISYDSTAVSFAIYDRATSAYLNSGNPYTSLRWNDVKNLIPGTTAASFMARALFILILQDPSGTYTVIAPASYNTADNAGIEAIPSLLPTFHANPADYAVKSNGMARESVLKNLHPLRNQSGDFNALAAVLCQ